MQAISCEHTRKHPDVDTTTTNGHRENPINHHSCITAYRHCEICGELIDNNNDGGDGSINNINYSSTTQCNCPCEITAHPIVPKVKLAKTNNIIAYFCFDENEN